MDDRTRKSASGASGSKGSSAGQDAAATAEEVNPKVSHEPSSTERAPPATESEDGETPAGLGPTGPETESNPSPS